MRKKREVKSIENISVGEDTEGKKVFRMRYLKETPQSEIDNINELIRSQDYNKLE